uniref:Minor tail protein n=2 Tax=unclassified bacterial viruses TaxID=12333 RepID=A0AAU7J7H0_9VIRU
MATSGSASGNYSGRTSHSAVLEVWRAAVSGTRAQWGWRLVAYAPNNASFAFDCFGWSVNVAGQGFSGCHGLDFRGTTSIQLGSGQTGWIEQGSGTPTIGYSFSHGPASIFGTASGSGSFTADALATVPGVPPSFSLAERGVDYLEFQWGTAAANGSAIDLYQFQVSNNSAMTSQVNAPGFGPTLRRGRTTATLLGNQIYYTRIRARNGVGWGPWSGVRTDVTKPAPITGLRVTGAGPNSISYAWDAATGNGTIQTYQVVVSPTSAVDSNGTLVDRVAAPQTGTARTALVDGLAPNTLYYAQVRARNAGNWAEWSPLITFTTPEATPPGLNVAPTLSGSSALLTATPPSGLTIATYRVQYRTSSTADPVTVDFTGTTRTITGLIPGQVYQWRIAGFFTGGSTPYSAWQNITQPSTNTNPGDYFDGATPAKTDATYAWDGTANNSASRANGVAPLGWRTFSQAAVVSGGTGVVARVSGGRQGSFAARTTFFSDTTVAGFHGGTGYAAGQTFDVQEGGTYAGGVYVQPSRSQRMAAEIVWLNSSRAVVGYVRGSDSVVTPDGLERLVVSALAPAGVAYGAIGWVDVAGDGWSVWRGGDTVLADDANVTVGQLLPFFSGDTPDTAQYDYAWLGAANASISERITLDFSGVDPLADPDCPPLPIPPSAPFIDDSCIEATGEWRRYWAVVSEQEVSAWQDVVTTLTLTTGVSPARQVRIRYWANPDGILPEDFQQTSGWDAEQIISYMPADTVLTIDGVSERVWAAVGDAPARSADRLLYGTGGTPASWPVLSCGSGYLISFDVPLDAPVGNLTTDIALTRRM